MWKQEIIDLQTEATKALMLAQNKRKPEDDAEYISLIKLTPIKDEAQCKKEDGSVDLNVREFTETEIKIHNGIRSSRGEWIENERRDKGVSTITEEKRDRAITAFMSGFSLETIKNKFKAMMNGIKETVKYGYSARKDEN